MEKQLCPTDIPKNLAQEAAKNRLSDLLLPKLMLIIKEIEV